jgi:hypothetical protein
MHVSVIGMISSHLSADERATKPLQTRARLTEESRADKLLID